MVDDVIFIQGLAGGCQLVGDAHHLGEIGSSGHVSFAGVLDGRAELDDPRPRLRGETLQQGVLDRGGGDVGADLQ